MAKEKPDLVYGTLDMLILKSLQHEPRHGLEIADRIQQMSKEILHVEQGSLYPALYRLDARSRERRGPRRYANSSASNKSRRQRAKNASGFRPTSFGRTCASARGCFGALPVLARWRFCVSLSASGRTQPCSVGSKEF